MHVDVPESLHHLNKYSQNIIKFRYMGTKQSIIQNIIKKKKSAKQMYSYDYQGLVLVMLYSFGTNPVHDSTCVCSTKLILLIGISLITWIINGKENVVRTNELKLNVRENSNGLKNHATHAQKGREWYQKKKKKVKTTVSLLLISFKRHLSC